MKRSIDTSSDYNNSISSASSYSIHNTSIPKKSLKRLKLEHEIFDKSIKDIEEMFQFDTKKEAKKQVYAYDCINRDFLEDTVYPPANTLFEPKAVQSKINIPILPSQRILHEDVPSLGVLRSIFDHEYDDDVSSYRSAGLEQELLMIDRLVCLR